MLDKLIALPKELGDPETLLADTGYFSARNVEACEKAGIDPLIAMGRQRHHPPLDERFKTAPPPPENPTPVEAMAHRLKTRKARSFTPCANTRPSRCSALSNRRSDSANFRCEGSKR